MIRIVIFFLIGMIVLAIFGKLRMPKLPRPNRGAKRLIRTCPACGAPVVGRGPCPCGKS